MGFFSYFYKENQFFINNYINSKYYELESQPSTEKQNSTIEIS